ncbi:HAD family hydrolase [Pelosinus sp. sgz500959]|uniref:HAD family hydrolase n=1 Tax=Pelosinus sp. sgz500959 TaxID=3242472 RepID=UPI003670569D
MIFASDLDQTLIYSPKSFRLLAEELAPAITSIELYEGREISFMADDAIAKLQAIVNHSFFVPATTRTIDQYRRISLFHNKIKPAYVVVSNGGNLIINGNVDTDWQKNMARKIIQLCLCAEDMLTSFKEFCHASWAGPIRMADDLFYYCVVERDKVPISELESFSLWAQAQNWNVSLQGRKLYIVPQVVNKWAGVAHIRELLQEEIVVAAGDSLLDLCMLKQADYGIAPCHGELWDRYSRGELIGQEIKFTNQAGILASNDILNYVDGQSKNNSICGKRA